MNTITIKEIEALIKSGRTVHVYPRKKIVCVDGYKYFKLK